ncbi:hypothetical protein RND71_019371 [Anisodus tanguticus]|uniref:Uncharacterized protein n=1 Tax=Anisodus tanguticus TaxID=243964 RepID=A0AAE1RXB0_9SOLA|nr:hypothetical protein RND71_019371 [Anisodus tanguticus]
MSGMHHVKGHYMQHGGEIRYKIFDKWWSENDTDDHPHAIIADKYSLMRRKAEQEIMRPENAMNVDAGLRLAIAMMSLIMRLFVATDAFHVGECKEGGCESLFNTSHDESHNETLRCSRCRMTMSSRPICFEIPRLENARKVDANLCLTLAMMSLITTLFVAPDAFHNFPNSGDNEVRPELDFRNSHICSERDYLLLDKLSEYAEWSIWLEAFQPDKLDIIKSSAFYIGFLGTWEQRVFPLDLIISAGCQKFVPIIGAN